ncbi:UTP-glucose-1-phosphate uridylyltransferase [Bacillus sp. JCM 19046]|nr:UTP-glucose-1-phosphate uridylyltransferase [Bacillus sp. JCM 19045]GAF17458.1 UTP-glucose-1-phosphate uridylyltransferase [Bacillus sp. JCM 19046]
MPNEMLPSFDKSMIQYIVIGDEPFAVLLGDDIVQNEIPSTKQLIE